MTPRVFIDTDVLLDVLLKREPHWDCSRRVLALCETGKLEGTTSALILANVNYILARTKDPKTARAAVGTLREILTVLPLTNRELGQALASEFSDLEDGMQYFVAVNQGVGTFITRNVRDFRSAVLAVRTPGELLGQFRVSD